MENINKYHRRFFDAAYAVAIASPGVGGKNHNRFRLAAVIVDSHKRILAARHNQLKTHPKLCKYFPWPYCHAEAYAILSLGMDNCLDKSIYVIRVYRNNEIALAKPCQYCMELIKEVGIKNIYYTTHDGYKEILL